MKNVVLHSSKIYHQLSTDMRRDKGVLPSVRFGLLTETRKYMRFPTEETINNNFS